MDKDKLREEWIEVEIDRVMNFYARDFRTVDPGRKVSEVLGPSWFVDTRKGKVIFRFYTEPEDGK